MLAESNSADVRIALIGGLALVANGTIVAALSYLGHRRTRAEVRDAKETLGVKNGSGTLVEMGERTEAVARRALVATGQTRVAQEVVGAQVAHLIAEERKTREVVDAHDERDRRWFALVFEHLGIPVDTEGD